MSQITHKNLETGESVSFSAFGNTFEYQSPSGDCFALDVAGYHASITLDEYVMVDALAFKAALIALLDSEITASLDIALRLDFNAMLVELLEEPLILAEVHHKAPHYWVVRLDLFVRYPKPNCIDKSLSAQIIGRGPSRHDAVVAAHSWLSHNSEYRDFISMPTY